MACKTRRPAPFVIEMHVESSGYWVCVFQRSLVSGAQCLRLAGGGAGKSSWSGIMVAPSQEVVCARAEDSVVALVVWSVWLERNERVFRDVRRQPFQASLPSSMPGVTRGWSTGRRILVADWVAGCGVCTPHFPLPQ
jgi:hypothetical protein